MRYLVVLLTTALVVGAQQIVTIPPVPTQTFPAQASQTPPAPATKPEDLCTVQGQVVSAATGEFLKKASLVLTRADPPQMPTTPPQSYSTETDLEGKFSMKDIEPGRYRLRVMRNGFVGTEYGSRGPMRPGTVLTFDRGKTLKDIVIRLTPQAVVTGRIVDADGEPIANVSVQLVRTAYMQGRRQLMPASMGTTNDLGEYRIFGVAPGKYFISATARQMNMAPYAVDRSGSQTDENHVPTYYPGTVDSQSAAQIELTPGAVLGNINWKLSKVRTARVKGNVTQTVLPGRHPINVHIMPRSMDSMVMRMAMNTSRIADPAGNFELTGVIPGSYMIQAYVSGNGKSYTAGMPINVGSDNIENVKLVIGAGLTVTGTLRVEGESTESLSNVNLRLGPREQGAIVFSANMAKLNSDGTFRIEDVGPDRYNVMVFGLPEGFYVKSVRSGETDVLLSGYDATSGAPGPLSVVLSPNAGQVSGTVQNPATQRPAAGATVVLIPQEQERRSVFTFYKTITTDQFGNFTIKTVTPGDYKVFAWEDLEPGAYMDPEFLKSVESTGEAVSVRESGKPAVQLKLIPADK